MTEDETIQFVDRMNIFDRLTTYLCYFTKMTFSKYESDYYKEFPDKKPNIKSFSDFCDIKNIIVKDNGINWNARGKVKGIYDMMVDINFASRYTTILCENSIYHYVYHNISI